MASILKRKGGPLEVVDSPKRVKSVKELKKPTPKFAADATGWDAAFKAAKRPQELVAINGSKEDDSGAAEEENALQAEDFENFFEDESQRAKEVFEEESRRTKEAERPLWKSTEPIGGRMINVDPVFSMDEKFLIVATRVSIHVYSTVDSLLARSIRLQIDFNASPGARIITYCLSPTSPNLVWVACSHGAIYSIDWTTGAGADQYWGISSTGCIHMTVASMESAGRRRDVVFTTELRKDNNGWRITANELASPNGPIATVARTIYTSTEPISFLKTANQGSVIVAASERRVLIGSLRSTEYNTIDKIRYEFRIFLSTDLVSALDVRVSDRRNSGEQKSKKNVKKLPIVDVVVGDVKGSIFVHNDLLVNLIQSQTGGAPGINLLPRKLHWHRQAVYSVKWSQDGNYIISGGTETVLLLWQLDTGLQQMLPHMSATIQNVVVSPSGSSYGIQLADNSAMVLSTAELKPTANIAGIQAPVVTFETSIPSRVDRVKDESWESPLVQRTPAVINPQMPSRLLLGVGQIQEISHRDPTVMSAPYLQTFDLSSGHNISRQAVTRTNVTNVNIAPSAHLISEPRITHMQISTNGNWLATVDEWLPPKRDLQHVGHQGIDLETERLNRREVFLKFWQWNDGNGEWELVSRIDAPHTSGREMGAGRILDLASDPSNLRFSTIGEDNIVRTWSTRTRKRDGVVVRSSAGTALKNWTCEHAVQLGKPALEEDLIEGSVPSSPQTGCVAFSDDGSTLAAASGNDGVVHLLDPESGIVRLSRSDMFCAEIIKLEILGQDLVTLSDFLLVYDLVADEIRYSVSIGDVVTSLSTEQKLEMMHLAIDRQHQTFAVALPSKTEMRSLGERYVHKPLLPQYSELAVFSPNFREALMKATVSTLVTALVPAVGSEGYISLDTSAEITTTLPEGKSAITALAMATSELQPAEKEESTGHLLQLVEDSESMDEDVEAVTPTGQDEYEDDDDEIRVTQQQLSAIFDVGPAFALPPMEEMFYQVAGLFTHRPKS